MMAALLLPVHVVVAQPAVTPGNVVFEDDFATYSNRWQEDETPKSSVIYQDGTLAMRATSPGISVWSVPDFDVALQAYSLEVTVTINKGELDSGFGFVLNYHDGGDFYALVVTIDGTWHLLRHVATEWIDLTPESAASLKLATGMSTIRLRVDVWSDALVWWVNEHPVGEVMLDEVMSGGLFGLIVQAGRGCIDVAFDDVMVRAITND